MRRATRNGLGVLLGIATLTVTSASRADDELRFVPVVRAAMGPSFQVEPDTETLASFALDVTGGISVLQGILGGMILNAEAGYAFDSRGDNLHAFNLTAGIGYGNIGFGLTLQPRLLLGALGEDFAVGMRNGLVFRGGADVFSLEVGHRFLSADGPLRHDAQLLFGVNVGAFVYLMAAVSDIL